MTDREWTCRAIVRRDGAQRNKLAVGAREIDVIKAIRILAEFRISFHHHVVLVQPRVYGRYLPLPEGVVKRVINRLLCDTQARCGNSIGLNGNLEAPILLVDVD